MAKSKATDNVKKAAAKSFALKSEELLRALIEQNPAIIYIANFDQKIGVAYISPQIESLGFTQEEWLSDPELWIRQIHPDDRERVLRETQYAARHRQTFRSEYRLLSKDGEIHWFLDEGKNILDENGEPLLHQGLMLDITERKKAEEALSAREHYLSRLNEITALIITLQNIERPVEGLAQELKDLFNADHCFIIRWDEASQKSAIWNSASSIEHNRMTAIFPNDERSITHLIIQQRKSIVIEDLAASARIDSQAIRMFSGRSMIGLPLLYKDAKIGAIIVAYDAPRKFDAAEIERAEHAGNQIAIAIWSAQQDYEIRKRLNEQKALAQITTALSQVEHIGLANVLDLIVRSAKELIPEARQAVIHLADKNNEYLVSQAVSGYALTRVNVGKIRIGEGAAGLVMSSGESIYIPSIQEDARFINLNADVKYNSLLVSPVGSGGRAIGTISIQSEKPFAFQKSDIELLNELGLQAAIAIENTRLYDAAQRELKDRILAEAALRGSEERYRSVAEDISALICRFERDGTLIYVNRAYADFFGGDASQYHLRNLFDLIKEQEQRSAIKSRYLLLTPTHPFITYETRETNRLGEKRWMQWTDRLISHKNDAQAEFQSIGIDITERKLAEIERERLLTAEHELRLRAETSADATLALVSRMDLDQMLIEILNQVKRLLPNCGVNIALLEGDVLKTVARRGYENRGDELYRNLSRNVKDFPLTKTIGSDLKILIVKDTAEEPNWMPIAGLEWIRSHLSIPLVLDGKLLGVLHLDEDAPNKFSEETVALLKPLTNAITVALESAALIHATRQALRETQALYRIHRGMSALNLDELLDDTVNLLKDIFNYYHVQVLIPNAEKNRLRIRAASGEIGKMLVAEKHEISTTEGIIGHAAQTRAPFTTNNVDDVPFYYAAPFLPETKAEMALPVQNEEKLFGILDIQQRAEHPFSERDQQLAQAVAEQLAIAMHRADLYESLQSALEQEKSTRRQLIQSERLAVMGQLLASVSHELNNPLQAIQNALFLLKEERGLSPQGINDLEIVIAESEHMGNLIERLRETYRPSNNDNWQPTQINDIIEDVYALLATHLRKNNVAFEFHPEASIPSIMALSGQIRQVLLNLFINAVEAMPDGGKISVSVFNLREEEEVMLAISDTGQGIAPNILKAIFDPFVTNKRSGTGIGLTISHDIIAQHQGRITAENDDIGATFKIWLPVRQRGAEDE